MRSDQADNRGSWERRAGVRQEIRMDRNTSGGIQRAVALVINRFILVTKR